MLVKVQMFRPISCIVPTMSTRSHVTQAPMCSLISVCVCVCVCLCVICRTLQSMGFRVALVPSSRGSNEAKIAVDNIPRCFGKLSGLIASSGSDCGPGSPDSYSSVVVTAYSGIRGWFKVLGTVALLGHAHMKYNLTSLFEDENSVLLLGEKGLFLGNT